MKANRRDFMALIGGLALAIPHLELPTPLSELALDGFVDEHGYQLVPTWINGQPLLGVYDVEEYQSFYALFAKSHPYVTFKLAGPYRSTVRLRGYTEQSYRNLYHIVDTLAYDSFEIVFIDTRRDDTEMYVYRQRMMFHEVEDIHYLWERKESVFGYPSYKHLSDIPRLPPEIEQQAWGFVLGLTSKEPYDVWSWPLDNPAAVTYKRRNPRHSSEGTG